MARTSVHLLARDAVAVTCWCEAEIVHIPATDVGTRTLSCGAPGCRPPEKVAA
jgi:hypothetical protein